MSVLWEDTSCMRRAESDLQSQMTVEYSLLLTAVWNMRAKGPSLDLKGNKYRTNKKKDFLTQHIVNL